MVTEARTTLYQNLTWPEISEAAHDGTPVVIPIGATEQHGHHLPVCTDWVLPERILLEASRHRHFLVGPFIPFGYRSRPGSGGGQHIPGTVSLRATTFMSTLEDVLGELIRTGFTKIVLYNWHFENSGFVYEPAFMVSDRHPDVKIVVIEDVNPEYTPERVGQIWPDEFPGLALEHAAVIETSLWMHHCPDLVRIGGIAPDRPQRVVNHDVLPIDPRLSTASGALSSPVPASADKGKLLTQWFVERILNVLADEFPTTAGATG